MVADMECHRAWDIGPGQCKIMDTGYIPARKSQLKFYKEIELFNKDIYCQLVRSLNSDKEKKVDI